MPTANYTRKGKVVYIVDGDTIDVVIDLGFFITRQERVRLLGINTCEIHAADPAERKLAQDAKDLVTELLLNQNVTLTTSKPLPTDKYGRYLAEVWFIGEGGVEYNISNVLLTAGLAKPLVM